MPDFTFITSLILLLCFAIFCFALWWAERRKARKPGERHGHDTQTYQLVSHHEINTYLLEGWEIVDNLGDVHHGRHSVLMRPPYLLTKEAGI